jgi:hypothetical protein
VNRCQPCRIGNDRLSNGPQGDLFRLHPIPYLPSGAMPRPASELPVHAEGRDGGASSCLGAPVIRALDGDFREVVVAAASEPGVDEKWLRDGGYFPDRILTPRMAGN